MCPQPPVLHEKDKTPLNLKLISLIDKSTNELGITGGEPTLIGENLFVLINHIKKNLPNTAISLLSNGVKFANREYAMNLAKCCHHDLQIDVPLFSDIAEYIDDNYVDEHVNYRTESMRFNMPMQAAVSKKCECDTFFKKEGEDDDSLRNDTYCQTCRHTDPSSI